MSEHITHIAVLEDAVHLVLHAEAFDAVIKQSLVDHYDSALCASGTQGNHLFAVPLLEDVRQRRAARGEVSTPDRRLLAAVLGWLVHRATDDILDDEQVPRLEQLRAEKGLSEKAFHNDEHQIYEDAVMFREVYDGGHRASRSLHEPLSPATLAPHMDAYPGASEVDVENVELLLAHSGSAGCYGCSSLPIARTIRSAGWTPS